MDEKDWTFLQAIYDEKNLTRAAQKLYISQPGLTYRINQLEEELNIKIFIRGKGSIKFTKAGEHLAQYAKRMSHELAKLKDQLHELNQTTTEGLKISVFGNFSYNELPSVLKSFSILNPNFNFIISSENSSNIYNIFERLKKAEIHLAFMRGEFEWNERKILLRKDPVCLISKQPIVLKNLPKLPRIIFNMSDVSRKNDNYWWQGHFSSPPSVGMTVDKPETCIEMVKQGFGYGIVPLDFIKLAALQDELYILPLHYIDGKPLILNLWLFYREETAKLSIVKTFINFLKKYYMEQSVENSTTIKIETEFH